MAETGKKEKPAVDVCAAVIRRGGMVLVCGRAPDSPLAGCLEFPGGKFERGETLAEATRRELREELGVEAIVLDELGTASAEGTDRIYRLHFVRTLLKTGSPEPRGLESQSVQWLPVCELAAAKLLPADRRFAARLAEGAEKTEFFPKKMESPQ